MSPGREPREVFPIFRVDCVLYILYGRLLWMQVTKTKASLSQSKE